MAEELVLSKLDADTAAVLIGIGGGYCFRSRLAALGFTPGTRVRVIQNLGRGPMIVALRDTRIALGRCEAQRIRVRIDADKP